MSLNPSKTRKNNEIDRIEQHYLVGREKEIAFFQTWLTEQFPQEKIINLYGTGGIGKSYLLDEFRRLTERAGHRFLSIDCRALRTANDLCLQLLRLLCYPTQTIEQEADAARLTEICLLALAESAELGKTILALDTFENIGELEQWLREAFFPFIDPRILSILSGRFPLGGLWFSSPAWRQWIHRISLSDLDYSSVRVYLERSGIKQEMAVQDMWAKTKGHPLTLSLLAAASLVNASPKDMLMGDNAVFSHVVAVWFKEVPDTGMKELVEAAAILRVFNQELLSHVLDKEVQSEQFRQLCDYSFVQRVDRGWVLHDLLREAIQEEMQLRLPDFYETLWKRCVLYYYHKLKSSARKRAMSWEHAEWFYYIGNQLIQSLFYQQSVAHHFEPLTLANWADAEHYIEQRYLHVKEYSVQRVHPVTKEIFNYRYTVEDSLNGLKHIHLEELYALDPNCVKLARDAGGNLCGLFVIISINTHTIGYLQTHPLSAAYFSSLPESKLNELKVPGNQRSGYFVKTLDVSNPSDEAMMQASGIAFITHMLSAGFVVSAPPPHPLPRDILLSLGCEIPDVVHYDYDNTTPTPYYVIDTRGNKLQDYLKQMITAIGLAEEIEETSLPQQSLTIRETEVVDLLVKGCSNAEIADRLFLSETTVKKHVSHILKKLNIKNRVHLVRQYTERAKG
ncbi:helix-turn-helix domain-containing protein [Paenibacillus alba]|uniref:helix-turn-helix transcriptional regulator n=1 Tax=Paenibacillus alba TaxID=1197127 RepID=UPI001563710F|nr:LuxR family transcriptional regulator [Paenibacillus alba]NQX71634.1 helix-turn-helix domain-containing protein [Paenibacillus alba]